MATLDPELESLLEGSTVPPADGLIGVSVQFDGPVADLEAAGFHPTSILPHVASGGILLADLRRLVLVPAVRSVRKIRPKTLQLDASIPDVRANQVWQTSGDDFTGFSGEGVIIGIIDTGISFTHLNFRKPDTDKTTRILKIWDQTLAPNGSESTPGPINHPTIGTAQLGYGTVYDLVDINETLKNVATAPIPVRHRDTNGHGTHVAGIAAGNGLQSGGPDGGGCHLAHHYIGVAPKAELIVVRMNGMSDGDPDTPPVPSGTTIGTYNTTTDAIMFILDEARKNGKPVVINMSFGSFTQQMDGTGDDAVAMNQILALQPAGRAFVMAAGNEGASNFHAKDTIAPGATMELNFRVFPSDDKSRHLHLSNASGNLDVQLTSTVPGTNGQITFVSHGAATANSSTANGANGSVSVRNNSNRIRISINVPTTGTAPNIVKGSNASGDWKIELRNNGATPETFDAFCLYGSTHDRKAIHFLNHTTPQTTLSEDATATEIITVGSYSVGTGNLADSSGRGMTLDLRLKPEITAPGVGITSAAIESERDGDTCKNCCCACCQDFYIVKGGTSMAAPHVAGAIALLFQVKRDLTYTQALSYLVSHTRPKPAGSTLDQDMGWGTGKLDIKASVDQLVVDFPPPSPSPSPSPPVPFVAAPSPFEPIRHRFLQTERGPEWAALAERRFREIWELVQTNKRVATIWHRAGGPLWVRAAFQAVSFPGDLIPDEIGGHSLREGIAGLFAIFRQYGSEGLVEDLTAHETELRQLHGGISLWQLIEFLGEPVPAS